jgi:ABC-type microcin C transport system permease subunit YejE
VYVQYVYLFYYVYFVCNKIVIVMYLSMCSVCYIFACDYLVKMFVYARVGFFSKRVRKFLEKWAEIWSSLFEFFGRGLVFVLT